MIDVKFEKIRGKQDLIYCKQAQREELRKVEKIIMMNDEKNRAKDRTLSDTRGEGGGMKCICFSWNKFCMAREVGVKRGVSDSPMEAGWTFRPRRTSMDSSLESAASAAIGKTKLFER